MTRPVRIGSGAGFQGDRLDAALTLVARGELDYLDEGTLAAAIRQRTTF